MKTKCASKAESVNKEKHEIKNTMRSLKFSSNKDKNGSQLENEQNGSVTMNKDSVEKYKDRKVKETKEKTKISLETYRKKVKRKLMRNLRRKKKEK